MKHAAPHHTQMSHMNAQHGHGHSAPQNLHAKSAKAGKQHAGMQQDWLAAAPGETKWDFGEEEWAQSNLVWGLFQFVWQFLASLVYVVLSVALAVPRRRSSAKGA